MAKKKAANSPKAMSSPKFAREAKKHIQLRVRDFKIPLVRDAVVLGVESPIGPEAMHRALGLMNGRPFHRVNVEGDEIIAAIIIRRDLLKRLPEEELKDLILDTVKTLMSRNEVLVVDVDAELQLEIKR